MKIPYGLSNFKDIITEGYLYIDKTGYIEKLEQQGKFNILLRPRRFGKSLFLSTLWHYYDVRFQDDFAALFGKLDIGINPTPHKNSYQILFFDFSGVGTGSHETIERRFNTKVEIGLQEFLKCYQYTDREIESIGKQISAAEKMERFFQITTDADIYLLIDEYDHFANTILGDSLERFKDIIGKGGFVRSFYETIKTATLKGIVDRLFITGVTSITLDSFTSGFNIVKNLSLHCDFNQAIGFTNAEVISIIEPLVKKCDMDEGYLMAELAKWYNGYCFNVHCRDKVFNSGMVLYFVDCFDLKECRYPEQMLDDNIISDYGKIMQLFSVGDSRKNFEILEQLITTGEVIGLHRRKLDVEKQFDQDDFISLLLYMGFVTIGGMVLNETRYIIPNYVVQKLYYEYFKVEIEQRGKAFIDNRLMKEAARQLALHNNITPLVEEINKVLGLFSNRDFMNMDEKHIKAVILTLLYQSEVYFIQSEPEVNNRYPDILLLERNPFKVNYQFLFELKYSKKKDGARGMLAKQKQGIKQIEEYLCLENIKSLSKLKSYLLLTDGSTVEVIAVQ